MQTLKIQRQDSERVFVWDKAATLLSLYAVKNQPRSCVARLCRELVVCRKKNKKKMMMIMTRRVSEIPNDTEIDGKNYRQRRDKRQKECCGRIQETVRLLIMPRKTRQQSYSSLKRGPERAGRVRLVSRHPTWVGRKFYVGVSGCSRGRKEYIHIWNVCIADKR